MIRAVFLTTLILTAMDSSPVFDFTHNTELSSWRVVDDVVMGGRSSGHFTIMKEGHGKFYGDVSTENNGGFSSIRCTLGPVEVGDKIKVVIHLKGDGKEYQFRIKENSNDYYSYIATFNTSGEWEEIEIPLSSMYPSFRGRRLDLPYFSGEEFEEMSFLIANKRDETFQLILDKIELRP